MANDGTPRGQVLLIVALGMIVLLGIGALVVDLGLSWMLRRQEQNAADPAAIATAQYIGDGGIADMEEIACFYVQENGFFADDSGCAAALASGQLDVNYPPSGPHAGNFAGRPEMVQVVVQSDHPSFFGRIFGDDTATVTTGAVAAREGQSANSNSLVALDPVSCSAGFINGNGDVLIEPVTNPDTGSPFAGGYVHVNSECDPNGSFNDACSNGNGAFKKSGNAGSSITAPEIFIHGTCVASGGTVDSPVTEGAPQIGDPLAQLRGPRQEDYNAGFCPRKVGSMIVYEEMNPTWDGCSLSGNITVDLLPGVYYGGWKFSSPGTSVRMHPGIYIIAGGGISVAGPTIFADEVGGDPTDDPARVLIFSTDNTEDPSCTTGLARCTQGGITFVGQTSFKAWGLDSGPWKGMLLWQDGHGSNPTAPVAIGGQGALNIAGTIYAPKANVTIHGNGTGTATGVAAVQIISWTWEIKGNGDLYMPYDPGQLYHITQQGLVH